MQVASISLGAARVPQTRSGQPGRRSPFYRGMQGVPVTDADHRCFSDQVLIDFQLGKLEPRQIALVASELQACPQCAQRLAAMDDVEDGLVAQFKGLFASANSDPQRHDSTQVNQPSPPAAAPPANHPSRQTFSTVATASPRLLGPYRIEAQIGRGGMGTVWQATHEHLKRKVAIKLLPAERLADSQWVSRFFREMEVCGRLIHPNLVHAYDAGEVNGQPFLAMELLSGVDLAELVRRTGPLSVPEACEVTRQAAVGLEFAHAHHSVHRDIKPSNLFLTNQGTVKVLDLGLARLVDVAVPAQQAMTGAHELLGTLAYMAPEQFHDSHSATAAADIYGLGCTLFFLLMGGPPFAAGVYQGPISMAVAHATTEPPKLPPDVPGRLADLVQRMLAKEPSQRPASMREVEQELAPFCEPGTQLLQQRLGESDVPLPGQAESESSAAEASPTNRTRRKWIAAALAAVCGIVLTIAGLLAFSSEGSSEQAALEAVAAFDVSPQLRTAVTEVVRLHPNETRWSGKAGDRLFALVVQQLPASSQRGQLLPAWSKKGLAEALAELCLAKSLMGQYGRARLDDMTMLRAALVSLAQRQQVSGTAREVSQHARQHGNYLVTLVHGPEQAIVATMSTPATLSAVQDAYRDATHQQSRALMNEKRWDDALLLWRHLHDRKLVTPELYLDAARCFHALGQDNDAARLISESLDHYAKEARWALLEAAGDLASELQTPEATAIAERAYTLALQRFQTPNP
jgi:serine/threonine protein kinase